MSFPPIAMSRRSRILAIAAALLACTARAEGQRAVPAAAHRAAPAAQAAFTAPPIAAPQRAGPPSRRAWIIIGTVATAAFGGITGWLVSDEEGDTSCLGGATRSSLTGTVAGAAVGLPLMLGVAALEGEADSATVRTGAASGQANAPGPRGWALVRWKARSTLVATAASAVLGGSIGAVAGSMARVERPSACRSLGRAIGDGSASYGGAMIGLTVPMAVLFDWPQ